jgi:hypothetical protein
MVEGLEMRKPFYEYCGGEACLTAITKIQADGQRQIEALRERADTAEAIAKESSYTCLKDARRICNLEKSLEMARKALEDIEEDGLIWASKRAWLALAQIGAGQESK